MRPEVRGYYAKGKLIGYLGLGCVMVAASWLCTWFDREDAVFAGWLGVGVFGLFCVFLFGRLFVNRAILIISEEGIEDTRWGVGVIPWCDVAGVGIESVNTGTRTHAFIALRLNNLETYLQKRPWRVRVTSGMNGMLGFSPFLVNCRGLDMEAEEALYLIQQFRDASMASGV